MGPLCRYPVRTPSWVTAVIAAVAIGAIAIGVLLAGMPQAGHGRGGVVWFGGALALGLVPLALVVSRRYRVARGACIEVHADRVEVPRPWRGHDAFPITELAISLVRVQQSVAFGGIPAGQLDRGIEVTFISRTSRRTLSDRVFVAPATLGFLLSDLDAVRRGEPTLGPEGWAAMAREHEAQAAKVRAEDPYEGRLDAELRDL